MKKFVLAAAAAVALMSTPALAQNGPPAAPAAPAAATAPAQAYTVDTQIPELLANPAAHEILQREIPDLIGNPQVQSAPISLRMLAQYASGALSDEKLNAINAALAAVH